MRIVSGIQNHTTPIAAPVSIDAVGTTPRWRVWGASSKEVNGSSAPRAGMSGVTANMRST